MKNTQTYKVMRKWADGKWHIEGRQLSLQKARNLYFRLIRDINGISDKDLRIFCEQDIFDVIVQAVDEQTGGIRV